MGKRVTVPQAAPIVNMSEYALRLGIKQGRYPHIRTSGPGKGKILIDIDLLEAALEREALGSSLPAAASNVVPFGHVRRVAE